MQTVLKIDLYLSPFKKDKAQELSQTIETKTLSRAKHLREKLKDGRQPAVQWTDEKLFTVQATNKHQNDRIYAMNKADVPLNKSIAHKRQKPACLTDWACLILTGKRTPIIFIDEGANMNQHDYQNMLKEQLIPWINATFKEMVLLSNKIEPHPTLLILSKSGATRIWWVSGKGVMAFFFTS